ncbi:MAG: DUF5113 domain-containing protein [Bacteroidaceae bacterium]|nr:DUF5113 domain-containing protein [Bacteroidaceae bacterium]MBQ9642296.1 DUF5113 domain-containing protein [Bacteroidaceae bacterium]
MSRLYNTIMLLLCLLMGGLLTLCTTEGESRLEEAQLDSARTAMLQRMDYGKAEDIYRQLRGKTRNKLTRLRADEGLMKLCQICSRSKEFYDYRSDAERLMAELRTAEQHMDARNDSIWLAAQQEFREVSAVYYYNLRDFDRAREILGIPREQMMGLKPFMAQYIGAGTYYYRSMQKKWAADALTDQGRYDEALDSLAAALYLVNEHHRKYSFTGLADTLYIYNSAPDTISTEMRWIQTPGLMCVPEWMASVRDQLSITLGAMGRKAESDYNHNIYFDILDATRQDMLMEQQLDALERHEQFFHILLVIIAAFALLLVSLAVSLYRRRTRTAQQRVAQLRSDIEHELQALPARWLEQSGTTVGEIEDQMEYADDERRAAEMEIEQNKRGYVDKATSVAIANGIVPFLDRALHVADRSFDRDYLLELIDKINDYNEVLGHWVKIRQGSVSLSIESFSLEDLFAVVRKATRLYESSGLTLSVQQTDSVVKADKALTLFMINTLMDNARKFTPQGGRVSVAATETEDYVEVSVEDTGYGMTEQDTREVVTAKKGHGFGLMNCRGIIEKYKKTNRLFSVCTFGVESQLNKGSRFYFRLPKGLKRTLMLIAVLTLSCRGYAFQPEDPNLTKARMYADSVFYANTQGQYGRAIDYGDSVLTALNYFYMEQTGRTDHLLLIEGESSDMPEVRLWQERFDTDYGIIVDVRNEMAIAALSLNRKHLYRYNSDVFTRMYQLLSQDESLSERIARLERTNANKGLVVNMSVLLLLLFVPLLFMYYYHKHLLPLFNLRQVKGLMETLFTTPREQFMPTLQRGVNDLVPVDDVCLGIYDKDQRGLLFHHARHNADESLQQFMNYAYLDGKEIKDQKLGVAAFPLSARVGDDVQTVGVMGLKLHSNRLTNTEAELMEWVAQSVAQYVYSTDTRIEELQHDLELRQDEVRRADAELSRIHVQNMILDNCLSTIKHETMYYPNRIKDLLLRNLTAEDNSAQQEVSELIHYYKEVFTVLSQCAMKQLERTVFRRRQIPVRQLTDYAAERARHYQERQFTGLRFAADSPEKPGKPDISVIPESPPPPAQPTILGDPVMLQYMLDTLLQAAYSVKECGELKLDFAVSEQFCTFALTDSRRHWTADEMRTLFYADTLRYDSQEDRLIGSEYLLCKQIIREHDEHCGIRGCRIYATDGNTVVFTLPMKTK